MRRGLEVIKSSIIDGKLVTKLGVKNLILDKGKYLMYIELKAELGKLGIVRYQQLLENLFNKTIPKYLNLKKHVEIERVISS